MNQISANILSLTTEAAVLIEKNRISFANPAALEILGKDCQGRLMKDVFGADLAGVQASSFIGDIPINGRHYIVRVSKLEFAQVIFLSPSDTSPVFLNDALMFAANDGLNNIGLAIEAGRRLAESIEGQPLSDSFRSLSRSFYSLTRIISNASFVRGVSDGSLVYELRRANLSLLFGNIMETVCSLYPQNIFSLNLGEDIFSPVDCKTAAQMLLNLISNCLVHADGCSKISVSLTETADTVMLSVSDNGCGIEADELHRVFDRYKHSFNALQMGTGAGLGLSMVKGAAELHGGTLLLESRPGQGTCVRVSFSKKGDGKSCLCAPQEDYFGQIRGILTGLADCLPDECFSEKFSD